MSTTRERILGVSAELFGAQGFEATSLREIGERLGFSKAAIYYHFHSKDDIFRALLEPMYVLQTNFAARLEACDTAEDWAEALDWAVETVLVHPKMYGLLERNRARVDGLAATDPRFDSRGRFQERVDACIRRIGATFGERVQLVCAFSSVLTFGRFGHDLVSGAERDDVRRELGALTRRILGVGDQPTPAAGMRPARSRQRPPASRSGQSRAAIAAS